MTSRPPSPCCLIQKCARKNPWTWIFEIIKIIYNFSLTVGNQLLHPSSPWLIGIMEPAHHSCKSWWSLSKVSVLLPHLTSVPALPDVIVKRIMWVFKRSLGCLSGGEGTGRPSIGERNEAALSLGISKLPGAILKVGIIMEAAAMNCWCSEIAPTSDGL